jgi:hypothetical protein
MSENEKPKVIIDTLKNDAELQAAAKDISDLICDYFRDHDIPPRTASLVVAVACQSIEIISKVQVGEKDASDFPDGDASVGIFNFGENWDMLKKLQGTIEREFAESRKQDEVDQ